MASRGRKKEPDVAGLIVGLSTIAVGFLYLKGITLGQVVEFVLWTIVILLFFGFLIWFFKGLAKTPDPKAPARRDSRAVKYINPKPQPNTIIPSIKSSPTQWSSELIEKLEWRVFEKLCSSTWKEKGYAVKETGTGADGGVDFYLYAKATKQKIGLVQCKSWKSRQIDVKVVRELMGVVASEQLQLGILMYSGKLSTPAKDFLKNPAVSVKLQGVPEILAELKKLPSNTQKRLLSDLTGGDYQTPSCPNCDVKMVQREVKKTNRVFWGCANFPKCKHTMN